MESHCCYLGVDGKVISSVSSVMAVLYTSVSYSSRRARRLPASPSGEGLPPHEKLRKRAAKRLDMMVIRFISATKIRLSERKTK